MTQSGGSHINQSVIQHLEKVDSISKEQQQTEIKTEPETETETKIEPSQVQHDIQDTTLVINTSALQQDIEQTENDDAQSDIDDDHDEPSNHQIMLHHRFITEHVTLITENGA